MHMSLLQADLRMVQDPSTHSCVHTRLPPEISQQVWCKVLSVPQNKQIILQACGLFAR